MGEESTSGFSVAVLYLYFVLVTPGTYSGCQREEIRWRDGGEIVEYFVSEDEVVSEESALY